MACDRAGAPVDALREEKREAMVSMDVPICIHMPFLNEVSLMYNKLAVSRNCHFRQH